MSTWAKCLDELNIPHQVEPRNGYTDSENRPDITTYDPTGHLTKDLDISLARPHSCHTVQSAAKISGYAAELREKRKMTKYGQQQSIAGFDTTCFPLVFEHFGFWGPIAEDHLDKISKISKDANGKISETDFRDRWRNQLSVVVQSCNSRVIFKTLSKLSTCKFDDFLYDKDVQHFVH